MQAKVSETADVHPSARIGADSRVWHLAQIREEVALGERCIVGRGAYVGAGVTVGDFCKIQNYALVYEPASLGLGVFIGPGAVLTNDTHPRAVTPKGQPKGSVDWRPVGVTVADGASIGARAVCVAPLTIGAWAMVAAGAVVVDDVLPHALVVGVPARQIGWVGRSGTRLEQRESGRWACSSSGETYHEQDGHLTFVGE